VGELHDTHLLTSELRVEVYGFDEGEGLPATGSVKPADVTPFVRSLRWRHSITAPYETISLTLALPRGGLLRTLPGVSVAEGSARDLRVPVPGSWVVVRARNLGTDNEPNHGAGWPALAWGRVRMIDFGEDYTARPEGVQSVPQTLMTRIECESWVTALGRSRILLTAGQTAIPEGFAYTLDDWSAVITARLTSASAGNGGAGQVLRDVFELVANTELPEGLGGGVRQKLAQAVAVVSDRQTCAQSAPLRLGQTQRVPGLMLPAANVWTAQSVWGFLSSVFSGGAPQVELFPSLEPPTRQAPTQGRAWTKEDDFEEQAAPSNGLPPKMSPVGRALGSQPVLLYRVSPHLYQALDTQLLASLGIAQQPLAQRLAQEFGGLVSTFGQDPTDLEPPARWYEGSAGDLIRYRFAQDDAERVNAVGFRTPLQPSASLELYGPLGLPAVLEDDVRRHGLRLQEIAHPYWILPPGGPPQPGDEGTVGAIHTAQAEVAYARLASNDQYFFGRAQALLRYSPMMQAGHFYRAPITDEDDRPGAAKGQRAVRLGLAGYLEAVEHSVELDAKGTPIRRTSVTLGRALFGPYGVWVQPAAVGVAQ
jgi:hypothetical protein